MLYSPLEFGVVENHKESRKTETHKFTNRVGLVRVSLRLPSATRPLRLDACCKLSFCPVWGDVVAIFLSEIPLPSALPERVVLLIFGYFVQ